MIDNTGLLAVAEPMVKSEESCRLKAYLDSRSIPTIAWGRADKSVQLGMTCTQAQADLWFDQKAISICAELDAHIPWWRDLTIPRQAVLFSMDYQLGIVGLLAFKDTLHDIHLGLYVAAAAAMKASAWDRQTPNRANREAAVMVTDIAYP